MKSLRQSGGINLLLIPLVLVILALVGVGVMASMFYSQNQDYKANLDQKVVAATETAKQEISAQKDKDFAEKEKFPYYTYTGPQAAGSIRIQYPKTWSAYVVAPRGSTTKPLEAYMNPGFIPSISDSTNTYALRVIVAQQSYDGLVKAYASLLKAGKVTITPYQSPNVPSLIGSRIEGEIATNKQGVKILLPFRDKTLQMWTESTDYKSDFDNIILKNFTLTP
jgi:hypothetical protein